jgi:hypothetical protein
VSIFGNLTKYWRIRGRGSCNFGKFSRNLKFFDKCFAVNINVITKGFDPKYDNLGQIEDANNFAFSIGRQESVSATIIEMIH